MQVRETFRITLRIIFIHVLDKILCGLKECMLVEENYMENIDNVGVQALRSLQVKPIYIS